MSKQRGKWEESIKITRRRIDSFPGHAVLCSAAVCYLTRVPPNKHNDLLSAWLGYCNGSISLGQLSEDRGGLQSTQVKGMCEVSRHIRWNPSIALTLGEQHFGRYIGVAFIEGLFCTQTVHLGPGCLAVIIIAVGLHSFRPLRGVPLYTYFIYRDIKYTEDSNKLYGYKRTLQLLLIFLIKQSVLVGSKRAHFLIKSFLIDVCAPGSTVELGAVAGLWYLTSTVSSRATWKHYKINQS